MAGKGRQLLSSTLVLSAGRIVSHGAILATIPIYTFFIPADKYGLIDLITVYVALLCPLVTFRLESAIFRYLAQNRNKTYDNVREIMSSSLRRVTINMTIVGLVGLLIVSFVPFRYFFEALFVLVATSYTNIFMEFARGVGRNKIYSIGQALIGLSTLLFVLIFVVTFSFDVQGVLLAIGLGNSIALMYVAVSLRNKPFMGAHDKKVERKLLQYSLPLIPTSMSWWVINVSDRSLISFFIDIGANGIYAVANKIASIPMVLFPVFSMALTETAVMNTNATDRQSFFNKTFDMAVRASFSFIVALLLVTSLLYDVVTGDAYVESYYYIPILLFAVFFNNITGLYSALYVAKKMTKQIMRASVFAAVINLVGNIVLLPFLGLYGAALSTTLGYLAMSIYFHRGITSYVKIHYSLRLITGLFGLLLAVTAVYYLHNILVSIAALPLFFLCIGLFNRRLLTKLYRLVIQRYRPIA